MADFKVENIILGNKAQPLAGYPHAKRVGPFVYLSGLSSRRFDNTYAGVVENPDGTFTLDIKEQTRAVIENMKTILETVHGSLDNLVDLTVFLIDMEQFPLFNSVYNEYFNAETGPSRTTVQVSRLPDRGQRKLLIEIKAVAYVP
ncbi:hypothetical protein BB560_005752 [Smittium megazygosporum]|uniref:2-aminomuconate deaminase n=1 Tax=Smittium megazygosporum TaxID=133381 RepID=A0A2T9Y5Q6_9FUNG|nr:hypothetical protein BB560_006455 [Smittium megazygosporum]PVU97223.1 hypothetical protein BB560_005752 [Smittium megazygosporum]